MQNNTLIAGLVVVILAGVAGFITFSSTNNQSNQSAAAIEAVVYKSPNCGCCSVYATYLDKMDGYTVEAKNITDMESIKSRLGVPHELGSCHTMEIGGYVIEGHIPEVAIEKLLSEQPDIKGIGMAGMPAGSPGMPGPKNADFMIYEITHAGEMGGIFMQI